MKLDQSSTHIQEACCIAIGEMARNGPLPLCRGGKAVTKTLSKSSSSCSKLDVVQKLNELLTSIHISQKVKLTVRQWKSLWYNKLDTKPKIKVTDQDTCVDQGFKGELTQKSKLSMFCVLSQTYQHFLEKYWKHPEVNCLRNSKMTLLKS